MLSIYGSSNARRESVHGIIGISLEVRPFREDIWALLQEERFSSYIGTLALWAFPLNW